MPVDEFGRNPKASKNATNVSRVSLGKVNNICSEKISQLIWAEKP